MLLNELMELPGTQDQAPRLRARPPEYLERRLRVPSTLHCIVHGPASAARTARSPRPGEILPGMRTAVLGSHVTHASFARKDASAGARVRARTGDSDASHTGMRYLRGTSASRGCSAIRSSFPLSPAAAFNARIVHSEDDDDHGNIACQCDRSRSPGFPRSRS